MRSGSERGRAQTWRVALGASLADAAAVRNAVALIQAHRTTLITVFITVLIGVSQFQPTALQEQASTRTAPSRHASVQSKRFRGWGAVAGGWIMAWSGFL